MKITIAPFDQEWAQQFKELALELKLVLSDLYPVIEHFGSTSIPGLAAKPVIDIMVGVKVLSELDKVPPLMLSKGYIYYEIYNNVMPFRRLFIRLKNKTDLSLFQSIYKEADLLPHEAINEFRWAHIHVWQYGHPEWVRHIAFREYLKAHPKIKEEYG